MTLKHIVLISVAAALGCQSNAASTGEGRDPAPAAAAEATSAEETRSLDIEGMTCASCNLTVKMAATKVDGVRTAKVSFETKQAVVSFDPSKTSIEAIGDAITRAGYPATQVKPRSAAN